MTESFRYHANRRAGHGYEVFIPDSGEYLDFPDAKPAMPMFTEASTIGAIALQNSGPLLVEGEPGAGKSHLIDDLTITYGAEVDMPFALLKLHINGANKHGITHFREATEAFRAQEGQKLVVIDNVDYIGYKGHRRQALVAEHSRQALETMSELAEDPTVTLIGIAHDDEWREGNWRWPQDHIISGFAQDALKLFTQRHGFEGYLTSHGLEDIATQRHLSEDFIAALKYQGLTTYFYASLLDEAAFLHNPEKEMRRIEDIRKYQHKKQPL